MQLRYPQGKRFFAIPNGGDRDIITAGKLKAEGVRPGIPDLFLPVLIYGRTEGGDRTLIPGLFIEMKKANGSVSPAQAEEIPILRASGYAVAVCYGWRQAVACFLAYISGKPVATEYK